MQETGHAFFDLGEKEREEGVGGAAMLTWLHVLLAPRVKSDMSCGPAALDRGSSSCVEPLQRGSLAWSLPLFRHLPVAD